MHARARIGALAGAREVLTSRTVRDLGPPRIWFSKSRTHQLKGLPEEIEVFRVNR